MYLHSFMSQNTESQVKLTFGSGAHNRWALHTMFALLARSVIAARGSRTGVKVDQVLLGISTPVSGAPSQAQGGPSSSLVSKFTARHRDGEHSQALYEDSFIVSSPGCRNFGETGLTGSAIATYMKFLLN